MMTCSRIVVLEPTAGCAAPAAGYGRVGSDQLALRPPPRHKLFPAQGPALRRVEEVVTTQRQSADCLGFSAVG